MNFHTLFLVAGLVTILGTLSSLRREHIRTEYSISWLTVGLVLMILALFPRALDRVAGTVDLDPRLFFLTLSGALISALVFGISHAVSKLRDENVMLTQRLAILEYHLKRVVENDGQSRR